jgi:hypothetical protein
MDEVHSLDVPILVETPGRPYFPMVRCHYISIEYDTPLAQWSIEMGGGSTLPFLMLGLSGIVLQPFGAPRFASYGLIESFFQNIEDSVGLSINFEDIWLPTFLFTRTLRVGDVYRVGSSLFLLGWTYRDARLPQQEFEADCKRLSEEIAYSDEETRSFNAWCVEQIAMAEHREPKDRRLQLKLNEEES